MRAITRTVMLHPDLEVALPAFSMLSPAAIMRSAKLGFSFVGCCSLMAFLFSEQRRRLLPRRAESGDEPGGVGRRFDPVDGVHLPRARVALDREVGRRPDAGRQDVGLQHAPLGV